MSPFDAWNDFIATMHSRDKDTPAKTWWNVDGVHKAVYRALRIDGADPTARFACEPFRYLLLDGQHLILAAWPTPRILGPVDDDWLGIEHVLAWDPVSNTARSLTDDAPHLFGAFRDETNTLFADPRAFFQSWAIARAQFAVRHRQMRGKDWHALPEEHDLAPGALLIGDLAKVRLAPSALPEHIECVGIDPQTVNRAIMRAARLPRASAATQNLRSAA